MGHQPIKRSRRVVSKYDVGKRSIIARITAHSYPLNLSGSASPQQNMKSFFVQNLWRDHQGQGVAEYAIILAIVSIILG